jgi:hypothetical protein
VVKFLGYTYTEMHLSLFSIILEHLTLLCQYSQFLAKTLEQSFSIYFYELRKSAIRFCVEESATPSSYEQKLNKFRIFRIRYRKVKEK